MNLINQLRHALGLPPAGEPLPEKNPHLSREQHARKVKARAYNKRARMTRRAQRLSIR